MDVLNTPFEAVLAKTTDELAASPAVAHVVAFDPQTREIRFAHTSAYNDVPSGQTVIYRFEGDQLNLPSFREAWNQAKTDVLRTVEKREKRFAHLG